MKRLHFLCALIAFITLSNSISAQQKGYTFTVTIKNTSDSMLYLGNYYANQQFAIDSAKMNKKGNFVFKNKERELLPGMYFFSIPRGGFFEFLIDSPKEKPNFEFTTDNKDLIAHMRVKGSPVNSLFYEYTILNQLAYIEYDSIRKNGNLSEEELTLLKSDFSKKMDHAKVEFLGKYPDHVLSSLLKATKEIDVPSPPRDEDGNVTDPNFQYQYYCEHFFDNLPLWWDGLVRTHPNIFYDQITRYFDQVLIYQPIDTIIKYADHLIEQSRSSKEVLKFIIWYITDKYLKSPILGHDAVYVHMIEKYYMTGEAYWASPSAIEEETKRAQQWKKLLLGKRAPELITKDIHGAFVSTDNIPAAYTILIFWSPDCGHCKTLIPEFHQFYKEYKEEYDLEVYAVNSEPLDFEKWKEFCIKNELDWINTMGDTANIDWREVYNVYKTPMVYLLDKDKRFIGKQLEVESTKQIIQAIRNGRKMY